MGRPLCHVYAHRGSPMDLLNDARRLASIGTYFIVIGWIFIAYAIIAGVLWWIDLAQREAFNFLEALAISLSADRPAVLPGGAGARARIHDAAVRAVRRQQDRLARCRTPHQMRTRLIWALAVLALVVAACSPGDASGGQLDGTDWVLRSYELDGTLTIVPDNLYADAEFAAQRVRGFAGCNEFDALYRAGGRTLFISQAAVTLRACDEETMAFEQAVLGLLDSSRTYTARRDTLTIYGRGTQRAPRLRRRATEPGPRGVAGHGVQQRRGRRHVSDRGHRDRRRVRAREPGWLRRLQLVQRHLRHERQHHSNRRACHHADRLRPGGHGPGDGLPRGAPGRRADRDARPAGQPDGPARCHQGHARPARAAGACLAGTVRRADRGTDRGPTETGDDATPRTTPTPTPDPDTDARGLADPGRTPAARRAGGLPDAAPTGRRDMRRWRTPAERRWPRSSYPAEWFTEIEPARRLPCRYFNPEPVHRSRPIHRRS